MWLLSDIINFANEEQVRVRQYVRNGRIVRSYTASRDIEEKDEPEQKTAERKANPMEGSLGVPLALVGIAGLAGVVALTGGNNKGVAKAVEEKVKVEKAVTAAKSPILSKLPQDLQDLRALYQSDKSKAMTSFYGGIDKSKPQEARLKFAQMVSQKELSIEEAGKVVESYDKATSGGVAVGTFKQKVIKQVIEKEEKFDNKIKKLKESLSDPDNSRLEIEKEIKRLGLQKRLVPYEVYGENFSNLGSGKQQLEQKQYLFLQEYLADEPEQYKKFKNFILGGSLIEANKGRPIGFSTGSPQETVKDAFAYGYTSDDIENFNKYFDNYLSSFLFRNKVKNIYK